MGVVELAFGVIFWIAAMLGLTAAVVSTPDFDLQSVFKVEVPGVGVPRQDVDEDVKALLDDWETATKDVEKVSFSAYRHRYDSDFRIIKVSHISFDSTDSTHGRMLIRPVTSAAENSTQTVNGIAYRYESGRKYEEWSSDGVELRHVDLLRKESETIRLRNAQAEVYDHVSMILDYGSFYRHLFAGFSTDKFLGRFNVIAGPMHSPEGEPKVYHLICEPHDEGAKGKFLRYIEKFEIIIDASSHLPMAIKFESLAGDRIVVMKFNAKE
ncbi:hypothetical protein [Lacunimicrobium album]